MYLPCALICGIDCVCSSKSDLWNSVRLSTRKFEQFPATCVSVLIHCIICGMWYCVLICFYYVVLKHFSMVCGMEWHLACMSYCAPFFMMHHWNCLILLPSFVYSSMKSYCLTVSNLVPFNQVVQLPPWWWILHGFKLGSERWSPQRNDLSVAGIDANLEVWC